MKGLAPALMAVPDSIAGHEMSAVCRVRGFPGYTGVDILWTTGSGPLVEADDEGVRP